MAGTVSIEIFYPIPLDSLLDFLLWHDSHKVDELASSSFAPPALIAMMAVTDSLYRCNNITLQTFNTQKLFILNLFANFGPKVIKLIVTLLTLKDNFCVCGTQLRSGLYLVYPALYKMIIVFSFSLIARPCIVNTYLWASNLDLQ
jgi:hypothetical protein